MNSPSEFDLPAMSLRLRFFFATVFLRASVALMPAAPKGAGQYLIQSESGAVRQMTLDDLAAAVDLFPGEVVRLDLGSMRIEARQRGALEDLPEVARQDPALN